MKVHFMSRGDIACGAEVVHDYSPFPDQVTCVKCIQAEIEHHSHCLPVWLNRRDEVKEMKE